MTDNKLQSVNQCIRDAAYDAAAVDGLSMPVIERFLRTGKKTWEGAGSGLFTRTQLKQDEAYTKAVKAAIRRLLTLLGDLVPAEVKKIPPVPPETIRRRVEPMVTGLVPRDWRETALRELARRTYVLNFQGTKAAVDAELTTCYLGAAWQILWVFFEDHGLKPAEIDTWCDGLSAGAFAHVRASLVDTKDPYGDVIVHEAAHLLHYLKPAAYGLQVRRGQERFVDVEFRHRELFAFACEAYSRVVLQSDRKARVSFAEKMRKDAFSFPHDPLDDVANLVLTAARARNGWQAIRKATVPPSRRRRAASKDQDVAHVLVS